MPTHTCSSWSMVRAFWLIVFISELSTSVMTATMLETHRGVSLPLKGREGLISPRARGGLSDEEYKKFGSMISELSDDEGEDPKLDVLPTSEKAKIAVPALKECPKPAMNAFLGPRVEFKWRPSPEQINFKKVTMCGSWTGWQEHYNLTRGTAPDAEANVLKVVVDRIPDGTHQFKFIVDDAWTVNDGYTISQDADGNANNVMRIYSTLEDSGSAAPAKKASSSELKASDASNRPWWLRLLLRIFFFWRK